MNLEQHKQMNIDALERIVVKIKKADTFERVSYCLDVAIKGAESAKTLIKWRNMGK